MAVTEWTRDIASTVTAGSSTITLGTLTVAAASITDTSGAITFGNENLTTTGNITGNQLAGTLTTAAQTNITSVGTLTSLNVSNLTFATNSIQSSDSNGNILIQPNGTGDVQLLTDQVRMGSENENVTLTTYGTGDLTISTNTGTNSGTITILDNVNTDISITPNGSGKVVLGGTGGLKVSSNKILDSANNTMFDFDGSGNIDGHITMLQGKKIIFDSADSYIYADASDPENLLISADNNLFIDPQSGVTYSRWGEGTSDAGTYPTWILQNNSSNAASSALRFENGKNNGNGATSDDVGTVDFYGKDGAGNATNYARIKGVIANHVNGAEQGQLKLKVAEYDGTLTDGLTLTGDSVNGDINVVLGAGATGTTTTSGLMAVGDTTIHGTAKLSLSTTGGASMIMKSTHANEGAQIDWYGAASSFNDCIGSIDMWQKSFRIMYDGPSTTQSSLLQFNANQSDTDVDIKVATQGQGTFHQNSTKHEIAKDITLTAAHSGDNTVIAELIKIPAYAIVTKLFCIVTTKSSNLGTYLVSIHRSTNTDIAADAALTGTTAEMIGAGAAASHKAATSIGFTDPAQSAADMNFATGGTNKIIHWMGEMEMDGSKDSTYLNVGSAPIYLYACNAGTGNGTTDSTASVLSIYCEYIGRP